MIKEMNLKFVKDLNTNSEVLKKISYQNIYEKHLP